MKILFGWRMASSQSMAHIRLMGAISHSDIENSRAANLLSPALEVFLFSSGRFVSNTSGESQTGDPDPGSQERSAGPAGGNEGASRTPMAGRTRGFAAAARHVRERRDNFSNFACRCFAAKMLVVKRSDTSHPEPSYHSCRGACLARAGVTRGAVLQRCGIRA